MTHRSLTFLGLVSLALVGCTGGDDGGTYGNGKTAEVGEAAQQALTVSAGGSVELDSGAARVQIPAGALTEDALVSIEAIDPAKLPAREKLASSAFDFMVDNGGATFTTPVMLTMQVDEAAMPEGAKVAISWLNGNTWEKLPGSVRTGDMVSAETTHFSTFAITFEVVEGRVTQTGGTCDPADFTPCGGNPVGVWTVSESCLDANLAEDPGGASGCEGLSVSADIDYTGTVTIDVDGSYVADLQVGASTEVTYPKSCLNGITDCTMVDPNASDSGDACMISESNSQDVLETGTWEASGNSLTLIDPEGSRSDAQFCVSGNTLRLNVVEEMDADVNVVMVMTRE